MFSLSKQYKRCTELRRASGISSSMFDTAWASITGPARTILWGVVYDNARKRLLNTAEPSRQNPDRTKNTVGAGPSGSKYCLTMQ